ncbi:hypothetical protein AAG906_016823 [Vitis piasezkii]
MKDGKSSSKVAKGENQGNRAPNFKPRNPEHPHPVISAMAKTRGGLSASPSSPTPRPQRAAMEAAPSPPVQAPAIPHPWGSSFSAPIPHPEATHGPCATSRSSRELCFSATSEEVQVLGSSRAIPRTSPEPPEEPRFQWICLPRPLSGVP